MNIKKLFSLFNGKKSVVIEKSATELAANIMHAFDEFNDVRSKTPGDIVTPVKVLYFEMPEITWRLPTKNNKSWTDYTLRKSASQCDYHTYHLFLKGMHRSGHVAEISINKLANDKYEAVFFVLSYANKKPSQKAIFSDWKDLFIWLATLAEEVWI